MAEPDDRAAARFWAKVDRRGPDDCWPWLAGCRQAGHGRLQWGGRTKEAHQVSFALSGRVVPSGLVIRHKCGVPWCVNPAHLHLGSRAQNSEDWRELKRLGVGRPDVPQAKPWRSGPPPRSLKERVLYGVVKDALTGCWNWRFACIGPNKDRPVMTVSRKSVKAYRIAYQEFVGPIPAGQFILHSCDNPRCCNPAHLKAGSHADNMRDMAEKGRAAKGDNNYFGRVRYDGERNPLSKLTDALVREIRASKDGTRTWARRLGLNPQSVRAARQGLTWKHIT